MALYGHTKIELTDVKTGDKKVIEKHNMVTNALRDMLQYKEPVFMNMLCSSSTNSILEHMRGIVCYSQPLNEDPDDYFIPEDNEITAHAGSVAYSGTNQHIGSYNSGLSHLSSFPATYVWDFDAEHGNGTISALSLVPEFGGRVLWDDSLNDDGAYGTVNTPIMTPNAPSFILGFNFYVYASKLYHSTKSNKWVLVNPSNAAGGNIRLFIIDTSFLKKVNFTMKNNTRAQQNPYYGSGYNGVTTETINVSSWLGTANNTYCCSWISGNTLYCSKGFSNYNNWANGTKERFVKINLDDYTVEQFEITNNTGVALWETPVSAFGSGAGYKHGKFFFFGNDKKLYAIDEKNNSDWQIIKYDNGNDVVITSTAGYVYSHFMEYAGHLLVFPNKGGLDFANPANPYIITPDLKVRKVNANHMKLIASSNTNNGKSQIFSSDDPLEIITAFETSSSAVSRYIPTYVMNPFVMFTINNLETPVTKTADQTMRITYTLTEEE